jgi:hypothetical protein
VGFHQGAALPDGPAGANAKITWAGGESVCRFKYETSGHIKNN